MEDEGSLPSLLEGEHISNGGRRQSWKMFRDVECWINKGEEVAEFADRKRVGMEWIGRYSPSLSLSGGTSDRTLAS